MTTTKRGLGEVRQRGSTWWVRYYVRGRRIEESSKSTERKDAVALLKLRLGQLGRNDWIGPKEQRTTYADLLELVRADYTLRNRRSFARVTFARKHLDPVFGHLRAVDITADLLEAYWAQRRDEGAADATVRIELNVLAHGFTRAVELKRLTSAPTFPNMAHVPKENVRNVFFTRAEVDRVLAELPPRLRGPVVFAWHTAWRMKSEVLPLEWRRVNLDTGVIHLEAGTTKNGEARTIAFGPIPELAAVLTEQRAYVAALERRLGAVIPWVWVRSTGERVRDFREAFTQACARAGVGGRVFHDLRRSGIRNLERAGVSRSAAKKMVGHKSSMVFDRYADASVASSDLLEAAAQLGALHTADTAEIAPRRGGVQPIRKAASR